MTTAEILKKIKEIKGIKTDKELADLLDVNQSQVTRWKKKGGFYPSTNRLICLLLDEYDIQKKKIFLQNKT